MRRGHAGEAEVLAIAVGAGGDDAGAAAERLLRLAPERALESIVAGAHATRSGDTRAGLVRTAATIESASSLTFLLSELKGPWLASRLAAAWELRARGRAEALPAMLNEWESLPDSASICLDFDVGRLARFLVAHADTATIARLEATYPHRPVGARAAMVSSLDGVGSDPAAATRFERLLTIALADRERFRGLHRSTRGPSSVEPRICDQAAEVLARAFPDRCRFTAEGVEARRDRDIRTMARDQFPRFRLVLPAELEETHARRVTVDANVPREEVLLRLCESVEGPLVADAEWTARLRRFFREVRTPCRRFELTISREAGDSSPIVRLLVVVGGEVPRLPTSSWSGCEVVFVDDQALVHSTWFGPLPWWRREEEFTTAVKEALSQPIERAIEIRLRVEESPR